MTAPPVTSLERATSDAAFALWRTLPGHWVVRVSEANRAGLPFWRAIVRAYTHGDFAESTRPGQPHGWHVFTFASAANAARR